jgi:MtN3 and saliva related transmembrane protein
MIASSPDALGLVAGALTTFAFVPQVVRVIRLRHADDLSWWMFAILSAGTLMWLWYGIRLGSLPVVLANIATLALLLAILVLKWRYRRGPIPERRPSHEPAGGK